MTQLDTGQYHGLNPVGALIWSLIAGQTFGELVEAVRAQLADPPSELAGDMSDFIEALVGRNLVEIFDSRPD